MGNSFFDDMIGTVSSLFTPPAAPPQPPKLRILAQKKATPEIAAWSTKLVYSPDDYPMGSMVQKTFGDLTVVARLEQHTWSHDKKTGKKIFGKFRGVTLYEVS